MDACHSPRPFARRPFIITQYALSEREGFVPVLPQECLRREQARTLGSSGTGPPCDIRVHHRRARKTGPGFALYVVECRTHGGSFTVYPPGHVPYGRVAVAPVDAEGRLVYAVRETVAEPASVASCPGPIGPDLDAEPDSARRPLGWGVSLFGAAEDAAEALPWSRVDCGGAESWRTQGRRIALAATLLGLTGADDGSAEAHDAGLLGVPALTRMESTAAYARAGGYRGRGDAVMRSLREFDRSGACMLDWLLAAGCDAGAWGAPWRWDPLGRRLLPVVRRSRSP